MKKLDKFHYNEAIDRTYCISLMLDNLLSNHPVIKKHKKIKKELMKAEGSLWEVYQMLGEKSN